VNTYKVVKDKSEDSVINSVQVIPMRYARHSISIEQDVKLNRGSNCIYGEDLTLIRSKPVRPLITDLYEAFPKELDITFTYDVEWVTDSTLNMVTALDKKKQTELTVIEFNVIMSCLLITGLYITVYWILNNIKKKIVVDLVSMP
jgi:hypothetical protein